MHPLFLLVGNLIKSPRGILNFIVFFFLLQLCGFRRMSLYWVWPGILLSFFLALEKYSNAVKHVLMFIFIIRVGAVGKVERGLMVFKFPRVERDSSVNRPTWESAHCILEKPIQILLPQQRQVGHRIKKETKRLLFITVKYILRKTNPEQ